MCLIRILKFAKKVKCYSNKNDAYLVSYLLINAIVAISLGNAPNVWMVITSPPMARNAIVTIYSI